MPGAIEGEIIMFFSSIFHSFLCLCEEFLPVPQSAFFPDNFLFFFFLPSEFGPFTFMLVFLLLSVTQSRNIRNVFLIYMGIWKFLAFATIKGKFSTCTSPCLGDREAGCCVPFLFSPVEADKGPGTFNASLPAPPHQLSVQALLMSDLNPKWRILNSD